MKNKKIFLITFLLINITGFLNAQILIPDRIVNWSLAGYGSATPNYGIVKSITSFGGVGDGVTLNDQALQDAINSLSGQNGIIYFSTGTFLFNSPIVLRSGLVLKGADASATVLKFNLSGAANNLITIAGSATSDIANLNADVLKDQNSISVDNAGVFSVNDYIKIYQNDTSLVNDTWALQSVGQIMRIQNISGNTITFYSPLRRNYFLQDTPRIQRLVMTTGVGIECLKIDRVDSTVAQTANIFFSNAAKCWVKGIESDTSNFAHIQIANSTNIEISGSYFHGAFSYGGGGKGYGISTEYSSGECLVENNVFKHLRHSMLIQSGANGNVFGYNYSREPNKSESLPYDLAGDIVMHGNYPYANLFEGNIVQNLFIDASHGKNGPFNTAFRNRVESYGIVISSGGGDSANLAGNEITGTGFGKGNYALQGNANFQFGNNKNGTILPSGTTPLPDQSYYYSSTPAFWTSASAWPSIGISNTINTGTIPAKDRYDQNSILTICPAFSVLGIHTLSVSAQKISDKNYIKWNDDNYKNVIKYEIEKSNDGIIFKKIGELSEIKFFNSYTDVNPFAGINYYRIHLIFNTGIKNYSDVVKIDNSKTGNKFQIFPNPATDVITITLNENATTSLHARIFNIAGKKVMDQQIPSVENNSFKIKTTDLMQGFYMLELIDVNTGNKMVQKFIKK